MAFYRTRFVEVCERSYTILQYFADLSNARLFQDVNVPLDVPEHLQLAVRAPIDFFRAFLVTLDITVALKRD